MKTDSKDRPAAETGAKWEQLYVLTGHWKSDLDFYQEDLQFLYHLVDKYMLWITKQENLEVVKEIKINTFELKKRCQDLLNRVMTQRRQLGLLVEDPNKTDASAVIREQDLLESEMALFVKEFRAIRKETFKITEYVIDSEALPSLLDG